MQSNTQMFANSFDVAETIQRVSSLQRDRQIPSRSKWHCETVDHARQGPFLYHVRHTAQKEGGWNFLVSLDDERDLAEADGTDEDLEEETKDEVPIPAQQRQLLRAP